MRTIEKTLIRQVNDRADPFCLNLGLGEPAFPTPGSILEHVREHIRDWKLGYTPNEGIPELREAIAKAESAATGVPVTADRVCVTVGSEEALFVALQAATEPGDEILVPDPGYPAYPSVARLVSGTVKTYPLAADRGFQLDPDEIIHRIGGRTRVLILNSPNNPSGAVYADEEWRILAKGLRGSGILVLSDECYRALTFGSRPASILRHYDNTIVINSLSKSHSMTGWRLGWAIAPAAHAGILAAAHQLAVTCASALSQRAALFCLRGGADGECAANLSELGKRRDLALAALKAYTGLSAVEPGGAFYLFAAASEACARAGGSLALALRLIAEEKVVVIPGAAFGPGGEGYLRISFASEPETIEEGLRRLGCFIRRQGS